MRYSIDTSAVLDAWVRRYPPDTFIGFWSELDDLIVARTVIVSEEVLHELERKADDVRDWMHERRHLFRLTDEEVQTAAMQILSAHQQLVNSRKSHHSADPFVIAVAQLERCAVITGESMSGKVNKPNIPDVCQALGIPCLNLLEFIRQQGWLFICVKPPR